MAGIDTRTFFHTIIPIFVNTVFIGDVIKTSLCLFIPFANVIAQHRFGMRRTDHNLVIFRSSDVTRVVKEGFGTGMHSRPYQVGF